MPQWNDERVIPAFENLALREFPAGLIGRRLETSLHTAGAASCPEAAPEVEVIIEVPRGSFIKRGSDFEIDFVSPLPCPYNYGAVPTMIGLEGDLLDAVVLGPRLALGQFVRLPAWGAVTLTDRGLSDDKLICGCGRPAREREQVLRFFRLCALQIAAQPVARKAGTQCLRGLDRRTAGARASRPRGDEPPHPSVRF